MPDPIPRDRDRTIREAIRASLIGGATLTLNQLSQEVSVSERALPPHLEHLQRSMQHETCRLEIVPAECKSCEFVFGGRTRFTRPGRCPKCRGTTIEPPAVRLR